jgi:hypothetical protein
MKKLFEISSEEKQRILEMHESATKKNYLSEQPVQQNQRQPPPSITSTAGVNINGKTYYLPEIIKDETSLNKFVMWPNAPISKSSLAIIGLRPQDDPKTIEGRQAKPGGNIPRNPEGMAFYFIQDYLTSIAADKSFNTKCLCNGTCNTDANVSGAEWRFKERFGDEDLKFLYQHFGNNSAENGKKALQAATKKALKEQLAKFPGVCRA